METTSEKSQPPAKSGERLALKSIIITVLILVLWAAVLLIQGLIDERQSRQQEAISEVSSKWGQQQTLSGPVLTIPYIEYEKNPDAREGGDPYLKVIRYAHFLPEGLEVDGKLYPEKRYRGIYEVVVYNSAIQMKGKFSSPDLGALNIQKENILYDDAFVSIGINDLRGIEEEVSLQWNSEKVSLNPGIACNDVLASGVSTPVTLLKTDTAKTSYDFALNLKLKGSQTMYFTPLGKETSIRLSAGWGTPSFDGSFLPDTRTVSDSSFTANWKVLHLNRNYPQSWKGGAYDIGSSAFGVNLLTPVDNYQKSTRTVKYAIMIIMLTFVVIFFIEILNQRMIHPFQYILIGLGLCIFYSLLIAISEHTSFNFSYLVSCAATIGLIAAYAKSVFKDNKLVALVAGVLTILHGYIFSLIQLEDYALLMGSIGLFIVLALMMYYSRKIDWYNLSRPKQ
jgi:inner membrane protein